MASFIGACNDTNPPDMRMACLVVSQLPIKEMNSETGRRKKAADGEKKDEI